MKKKLELAILFIVILTLSACTTMNEFDVEQKQIIEITDGNENAICQIADNKAIKEIVINLNIEQWESISAIPTEAEKQYTFTSYVLITEPIYKSDDASKIAVGISYLYLQEQNYYIETKDNGDRSTYYYKIPHSTGKYLVEVAGKTSEIQNKNDIFISWGIDEDEIAQSLILDYDNKKDKQDANDEDNEKYPHRDMEKFDYNGVAAVSSKQKIEIYKDDKIAYSTSDLEEIVNILNAVDMQHWEEISELSNNGQPFCTLRKYALPRKQNIPYGTDLVEMEYWEIYKSENAYYLAEHINASPNAEEMVSSFIIPNLTGEWFEKKIE
jgi:hypothetical protein